MSILLALAVLLSIGQVSLATVLEARQEPPPGAVVQGHGNFPRLPVVAPGADGTTLTLYLVEGDRATQLLSFTGTRVDRDDVALQPSPDGQHVAYRLVDRSATGGLTLGVVDTQGVGRVILDHGDVAWFAWLDDDHILWSRTVIPAAAERGGASWESDAALPMQGEIWLTDLAGAERRRLAEAPVYRVLGASPDGKQAYFFCEPRQEGYLGDGFCVLDVASGAEESVAIGSLLILTGWRNRPIV
jgi:hypothetical protein